MKKTQTKKILAHLQAGRKLTPLNAFDKFGCFRLAARIEELREAGHKIVTEMVHKNGKRFASYTLLP